MRRSSGLTLRAVGLVMAGITACTPVEPLPEPEQAYSFFGVAVDVELGRDFEVGRPPAKSRGYLPPGAIPVGPATIELHDGAVLDVPPNTPGDNMCEELYDPDSYELRPGESVDTWDMIPHKPEACVLIGEASSAGEVIWFDLLKDYDAAAEAVRLGRIIELEGTDALVQHGNVAYRFRLAEAVAINCNRDDDYRDVEHLLAERGALHETMVAVPTGEIVTVSCISNN